MTLTLHDRGDAHWTEVQRDGQTVGQFPTRELAEAHVAMRGEIERLTGERDNYNNAYKAALSMVQEERNRAATQATRIAGLEREVERLRTALEPFVAHRTTVTRALLARTDEEG